MAGRGLAMVDGDEERLKAILDTRFVSDPNRDELDHVVVCFGFGGLALHPIVEFPHSADVRN
ncbi:MAG: hypothetical protein HOK54_07350 [Alphaproteobacteria bacterium]|nr:hypothetical protein [Alphaproteobacteria bacterium]